MYVLVTYDVSTTTTEGRRRLTRVARTCLNYGQRVQNSVFECRVNPAQLAKLKHEILGLIDPATDSIRFYHLGKNWLIHQRVEHHGCKPSIDFEGPLIA